MHLYADLSALRTELTWVASAETSLTGVFPERCLPDELSLL